MAKRHISVMNTSFRDGFQSVYGARVRTKDFLPALEASVEAGFTHFEAGGGARYQSLYLYCQEDAFDMMDAFRETVGPDANLQTLARGVNVVALDSQSSDIIDLHAKLFKKHGMTTIRNFDALNDVRNLSYSGRCIVEAGLKHEVTVTLMELPPGCEGAHTPDFYLGVLEAILDDGIPFDSVCFKDASGTAVPSKVYDTVKLARKRLGDDVHIRLHTHETAGVSIGAYRAALDAGADGIDLALAPCSGGTSQPDFISMWHALRGTDYDLGIDVDKVVEAEAVFKECMKDYFMPPEATAVEPVLADARWRAHRQHPDDARQRRPRAVPRSDRGDGRGGAPGRLRHLGHPGEPVLLPAGLQQRDRRSLAEHCGRLRKDGARLLRKDAGAPRPRDRRVGRRAARSGADDARSARDQRRKSRQGDRQREGATQ
jgi:pyruvate carboxylase subunit B